MKTAEVQGQQPSVPCYGSNLNLHTTIVCGRDLLIVSLNRMLWMLLQSSINKMKISPLKTQAQLPIQHARLPLRHPPSSFKLMAYHTILTIYHQNYNWNKRTFTHRTCKVMCMVLCRYTGISILQMNWTYIIDMYNLKFW